MVSKMSHHSKIFPTSHDKQIKGEAFNNTSNVEQYQLVQDQFTRTPCDLNKISYKPEDTSYS